MVSTITPATFSASKVMSLEEWTLNPPSGGIEWIDGELIEKTGMTLLHSRIQSRITWLWKSYLEASAIGGEVYTEVPCNTHVQGRKPDVAYLTPELVAQYGDISVLPQSFPLIAEVISPTDMANDVFKKAYEYVNSGCEEVWLVLTEERWIIVVTPSSRTVYADEETLTSQVLKGFSTTVNALLG
jgi:Uma2 family endonuclease